MSCFAFETVAFPDTRPLIQINSVYICFAFIHAECSIFHHCMAACAVSYYCMKDLRDMLPYMDADITMFSDYSVNNQQVATTLTFCVDFCLFGRFVIWSV